MKGVLSLQKRSAALRTAFQDKKNTPFKEEPILSWHGHIFLLPNIGTAKRT